MLSLIFARAQNGVIGNKNKLPWHLPEDLKWFKEKTFGKPVIMGIDTLISILTKIGKPLPGRENLVLSSRPMMQIKKDIKEATKDKFPDLNADKILQSVIVCRNLELAIHRAESMSTEVFVIGGAKVFNDTIKKADKLYVTEVLQDFEGDTYFTEFDPKVWVLSPNKEQNAIRKHEGIPYYFAIYHSARGYAKAARTVPCD